MTEHAPLSRLAPSKRAVVTLDVNVYK